MQEHKKYELLEHRMFQPYALFLWYIYCAFQSSSHTSKQGKTDAPDSTQTQRCVVEIQANLGIGVVTLKEYIIH